MKSILNRAKALVLASCVLVANRATAAAELDLTPNYLSLMHSQVPVGYDFNYLRNYKIVLIEGYLGEPISRLISSGVVNLGAYFEDQLKWFELFGVETEILRINTQQTPEFNSKLITKTFQSSTQPILLLTHSKGGLDALYTLIQKPELQEKIKGFISLQGPFYGSPIANKVRQNPFLNMSAAVWLTLLKGSIRSLESLEVRERTLWMKKNDSQIATLARKIPFISFASRKSNTKGNDTLLEFFRNEMLKDGIENDGLVPLTSAILPYSYFIKADEVDHVMPVFSYHRNTFDRSRFSQVLFSLLDKHSY